MACLNRKNIFLGASVSVLLIALSFRAEQEGPTDSAQSMDAVQGKYSEKDIVRLPEHEREQPSQNVTQETEMAIRGDAARAQWNMRRIHQAWLKDASAAFVDLASTLPPEILDYPFDRAGKIQYFISWDPHFVVLTSIGPNGKRDLLQSHPIFGESIPDGTSVPAIRRALGRVTFDPTNGTISSGDLIRVFDLRNPSDRQEY